MSRTVHFHASPLGGENIDDINAIIRGVSVITSGLIAKGHDLEVDCVTLDQIQRCACERGQVPVKVDHKSGAAAVCGYLTNFRRGENKLKADWFLLQTHPQRDQILEVARRMPRGVGLSASFVSPDVSVHGKARCTELISVDYVTLPAANPDGMFGAKNTPARRDQSQPRLTSSQRIKRALATMGRGVETGAVGGFAARAYLLKKRPDLRGIGASLPASGALAGGLFGGALQWRSDRQHDRQRRQRRAFARRFTEILMERSRAQDGRFALVTRNGDGADQPPLRKPILRRIGTRMIKIGAGAALGHYVGRRIGARAGTLAGGVAGALFDCPQVRQTVRLAIVHAKRITHL
jgi:hypothetical protein